MPSCLAASAYTGTQQFHCCLCAHPTARLDAELDSWLRVHCRVRNSQASTRLQRASAPCGLAPQRFAQAKPASRSAAVLRAICVLLAAQQLELRLRKGSRAAKQGPMPYIPQQLVTQYSAQVRRPSVSSLLTDRCLVRELVGCARGM